MTTEIDAKLKKATDLLVASIVAAKSKWLDSVMARLLPTEVYGWAKSQKNSDRMKLSRWMARNAFDIMEGDGFTHIKVGDTMISEWRYRILDGKVEQSIRTAKPHELECLKQILSVPTESPLQKSS